jgi:hypothetical protein
MLLWYYDHALGITRLNTVRFTWRGDRIRIIGAGYWRKGRQAYEQAER